MELHQIQITYQAKEDRILSRASFQAQASGLQEVRAWLTRRLVKILWPGIIDALEKQVTLDKPQAAHASADIVGMEHHACLEEIRGCGSFDNPYHNEVQTYPLGENADPDHYSKLLAHLQPADPHEPDAGARLQIGNRFYAGGAARLLLAVERRCQESGMGHRVAAAGKDEHAFRHAHAQLARLLKLRIRKGNTWEVTDSSPSDWALRSAPG